MSRSSDTTLNLGRQVHHLQGLLANAEDVGYFGPQSAIWVVGREAVMVLGLARALYLQLAHPWVAQAVYDHSTVGTHPLGRLIATATAAELLVFGSRSHADATAARIRAVHRHVNGSLGEDVGRWRRGDYYSAEDPDALLWVLATLLDTGLAVYESCIGSLPESLERGYIRDGARVGEMMGVPVARVPEDRRALRQYMDDMIANGAVAVGTVAQELAGQLYSLQLINSSRLWRSYRELSVGFARSTLPAPLREQYGMVYGRRERLLYKTLGRTARILLPRLPDPLRVDPVTLRAIRRAEALNEEGWAA